MTFADVVRAYKGLLKEKEALEASLKALSFQQLQEEVVKEGEESTEIEGKEKPNLKEIAGEKRENLQIDKHAISDAVQVSTNYAVRCVTILFMFS